MSNIACETCGRPQVESPAGYVAGCAHHPPENECELIMEFGDGKWSYGIYSHSFAFSTESAADGRAVHPVAWQLISDDKPLFIPLKTEYYEAFCDGSKTEEYRRYGARWNENTCRIGRRGTLSKGYGKHARCSGVIIGFEKREMDSKAWLDCYGEPGTAAVIQIGGIA